MNLLHFDVEGGWGGSSISLFEIIKKLKKTNNKSFVVCRRKGPIQKKYKKENIKFFIEKKIYSFIPRKNGKNIKNFLSSAVQIIPFLFGILNIIKIIKKHNIDILHINYEGLFLLGFLLKFITNKPIIFHIRTQFPEKNLACKFIVFLITKYIADYIFFITDLERYFFNKYKNHSKIPKKILYNISSFKPSKRNKKSNIISYFGNISYAKGVDRIIDIAKICQKKKLNYKFKIFGKLNKFSYGKEFYYKLKQTIKIYKLNNIHLMGHVSSPKVYLSKSYLLIRLSRANDPYGRDIIEALTMGVPSIATGSYQGIIKNNFNGYLINKFSLQKIIFYLEKLEKNYKERNRLSSNCMKISYKFDGTEQTKLFEKAINFIKHKNK